MELIPFGLLNCICYSLPGQ